MAKKNPSPRILLLDSETGFNLVRVHSLRQYSNMIPYNAIESERYLICCTIKELGSNKVTTYSQLDDAKTFKSDPTNDLCVVKALREDLETADVVIGHNLERFDLRRLNARIIFHGFTPLPNFITIDTLKIARKHFDFNSARLDYLGQFLNVGRKIATTEGLWTRAFHGDNKAVQEMIKYNIQDVKLLEKVYEKLAPWATAKLNRALFKHPKMEGSCPSCGEEENFQARGYYLTRTGKFQRYHCQQCGHWFHNKNSLQRVAFK